MNNKNINGKNVFKNESRRFVAQRRENIKSDLITITEVKLENILLKHLHKLGIRKSWLTPLSLFITVLIAKSTATFNKTLGIEASVWEALFLLLMISSFVWFVLTIVRICCCWKESSISNLMATIKDIKEKNS